MNPCPSGIPQRVRYWMKATDANGAAFTAGGDYAARCATPIGASADLQTLDLLVLTQPDDGMPVGLLGFEVFAVPYSTESGVPGTWTGA